MKKAVTIFFVFVMAALLALPTWAETIVFRTRTPGEDPYIYLEMGSNDPGDGKSRFHDGTNFIIYEFPCPEGSKYAALTWKIQAQFEVSVTNTDPDDDDAYEVIHVNEPTEEEIASGKPDWGYSIGVQYPTYDLSKWCENNTTGKIWVKMADADPTNGWGGYIFGDFDITYYVGTEPPPTVAKPKTAEEDAADILASMNLTANDQAFVVGTSSEQPFFYKKGGNIDGGRARFMDGTEYVIYQFDVRATDTVATISMGIDQQYEIRATSGDPDDLDGYTLIAVAEPNENEDPSSPNWGSRRDENGQVPTQTFDLSHLLTGKDGKIYVYIGDCQPDAGWGGRIAFYNGVRFTSYGPSAVSAPATGSADVPAPATAPATMDSASFVAIMAIASAAAAAVLKKKR
mgnify:CR=1 FL=1